jgi:hypothetical protein
LMPIKEEASDSSAYIHHVSRHMVKWIWFILINQIFNVYRDVFLTAWWIWFSQTIFPSRPDLYAWQVNFEFDLS